MGNGVGCLKRDEEAYWVPTAEDDKAIQCVPENQLQECWFSFIYAKYIPFMVRERFKIDPQKLAQAEEDKFEAAVAFVDISGFTKLSERLIQEYGPEGAEKLNVFISSYFDKLIKVIIFYGGDIIKFAGDAMLVVWRSSRTRAFPGSQRLRRRGSITEMIRSRKNVSGMFDSGRQPLRMLVLRAVMCNLYLINRHNNFLPPGLDESAGIRLQLHTGIGAGVVSSFFVGGTNDSWEFFVAGDPIEQMSIAGDKAKSGDVVLSHEVYEILEDCVVGRMVGNNLFKVVGLKDRFQVTRYEPPLIEEGQEDALTCFVPIVVKKHVESGINMLWLPEYRKVFIMFVVLKSVNYNDPEVLQPLQQAVCIVQQAVFSQEGTIARFLFDDKGTRFKIAFGMPTLHHDDDACRVTRAALRVREELRLIGQTCAIGIASGWVYCGEAGSGRRCEYTAVGNKVIVAARLTSKAGEMGNIILCDQETYDACSSKVIFEVREPTKLKGVTELVPIFEPLLFRDDTTVAGKSSKLLGINRDRTVNIDLPTMDLDRVNSMASAIDGVRRSKALKRRIANMPFVSIAGRQRERRYLLKTLKSVQSKHNTRVVMIEGEGGMGKSILITDFMLSLEKKGVMFLVGGGDSQANNTPYFAYRFVFQELLGIDGVRDGRQRNRIVQKSLGGGLSSMAALLNPILGTTFEEMPFIQKLNADTRGDHTHRLLLTLLQDKWESDENGMMVIVLEDMQYCDSATWALTYDICMGTSNLCLVLSMRRPQRPYPPDYKKLRRLATSKTITLTTLSKSESEQVALAKFGVESLPSALVDAIFKKTQGHPLYIEEICHALLNQNLVWIIDGRMEMNPVIERDGLKSVDSIKGNVTSVITGRIDHLPAELRVTLQICAVIGREVPVELLKAVHHSRVPTDKLRMELYRLQEAGFLTPEDNENNPQSFDHTFLSPRGSDLGTSLDRSSWLDDDAQNYHKDDVNVFVFKHQFFQEAAYQILPVARRKELHLAVAQYMEAECSGNTVVPYSSLVHHFTFGHDHSKVYHWTRLAGTDALAANVIREAVHYFQQSFDVLVAQPNLGGSQHRVMVSETRIDLGKALYLMGRYDECLPHLREALAFRGIILPHYNGGGSGGGQHTNSRSALHDIFKVVFTDPHYTNGIGGMKSHDAVGLLALKRSSHSGSNSSMNGAYVGGRNDKSIRELVVPLLNKMTRACCLSGEHVLAGHCAHKLMRLGERLSDAVLVTLANAYCAVVATELQWDSLAQAFHERVSSQLVYARSSMGGDSSYIEWANVQHAVYMCGQGEFGDALVLLNGALTRFVRQGDSKMWRETNYLRGWCLMCLGDFHASLLAFHDVMMSAQKDGDVYFETHALYWEGEVRLITHGGESNTYENLRVALSISADFNHFKVPSAVLLVANCYHQMLACDNEDVTIETFRKLVNLNLTQENVTSLMHNRHMEDGMVYFRFLTLLLDALAHHTTEDTRATADIDEVASMSKRHNVYAQAEEDEEMALPLGPQTKGSMYNILLTSCDEPMEVLTETFSPVPQRQRASTVKEGGRDSRFVIGGDTRKRGATAETATGGGSGSVLPKMIRGDGSGAQSSANSAVGLFKRMRRGKVSNLLDRCETLLKSMKSFSNTYSYALPIYCLLRGRFEYLMRREKKAIALWNQGLGEAKRMRLNYFGGLILTELAACTTDKKTRLHHAQCALLIFNQHNVKYVFDPRCSTLLTWHKEMASMRAEANARPRGRHRRRISMGIPSPHSRHPSVGSDDTGGGGGGDASGGTGALAPPQRTLSRLGSRRNMGVPRVNSKSPTSAVVQMRERAKSVYKRQQWGRRDSFTLHHLADLDALRRSQTTVSNTTHSIIK